MDGLAKVEDVEDVEHETVKIDGNDEWERKREGVKMKHDAVKTKTKTKPKTE